MILVKAGIDRTTRALAPIINASKILRDVDSVVSTRLCYIAVEIEDQPWCVVSPLSYDASRDGLRDAAAQLSKRLKVKTVFFNSSDDPVGYRYQLFQNGSPVERFDAVPKATLESLVANIDDRKSSLSRDYEELARLGGVRFSSKIHTPESAPKADNFARRIPEYQKFLVGLLRAQGAFVPEIPAGITEDGDDIDLGYAGEGIGKRIDFLAV